MKNALSLMMFAVMPLAVFGAGDALAANCSQAADRVVAETGGTQVSVNESQQNGQIVCTVTVRVPGKNGEPPRLVTREVKQ